MSNLRFYFKTMRINLRNILFILIILSNQFTIWAVVDTVQIKEPQIPIMINRVDNPFFYLKINAKKDQKLTSITLKLDKNTYLEDVKSLKLYYSGTESLQRRTGDYFTPLQHPLSYIPRNVPGKAKEAEPSYSIKVLELENITSFSEFKCNYSLFPGINYFWISIEMKENVSLLSKISADIVDVQLDGKGAFLKKYDDGNSRLMGIGVRYAGDDGAAAYRIPGIAMSNDSTLLSVYDIRYNNSSDLQQYIDVGLSRSLDKGQTWEPMKPIMQFKEADGLPLAQNGVGDPAILIDKKSGTIWVAAIWTHGMGNGRAFKNSEKGMDKTRTAQLMLVKSIDDGKTWSSPINITEQVKKSSWRLLLQGPGMGITMDDGTLVFPIQYVDSLNIPNAGVMYSKDSGKTWHHHNYARTNTTEAQVAEIEPGVLMLNMRDNRKGSRAVYITKDLGKTWYPHSSNRSALIEPVCMASLIMVKGCDNITGKDILFFSNPNTVEGRHSVTIKASLDKGKTWKRSQQLLLDEAYGWGYSCLTLVDKETLGILYEGSQAHMVFQRIKIKDILN